MSLARKIAWELLLVAASLAIGLIAGMVVAWWFDAPPLETITTMLTSYKYLPDMVAEYTAILALTGLAFSLPLYTGLFNIGAEGSLYLGALLGLWTAVETGNLGLSILVAVAAGAALTGVAGALRVWLRVNEVLSTIMLNWISYWVMLYAVVVILANPVLPQKTLPVPREARIPWITVGGTAIPGTLVVTALVVAAAWVFVRMTRWGLITRAVGGNEEAVRLRGIKPGRYRLASMIIAGGLAGLAGVLHIAGFSYSIDVLGGTVRNYGFNGIGVALMGRNDPLGILAAAFLFALLLAGSQVVEPIYGVPKEAADVIVGIVVILLAAPEAFRMVAQRLRR